MVPHVLGLPSSKVHKVFADAQKVFAVCFTETLNLLFECCFQQTLNFALRFLHLLKYLSRLHILLFPRLLQHCRQVKLKLESLLVSEVGLNILGDSE